MRITGFGRLFRSIAMVATVKNAVKNVNDIEDYDYLDNLEYSKEDNNLTFDIIHYHKEPKITRYVQCNYERIPIYGDYKERTKIVKKFNKKIFPDRFMEEDILKINELSNEMRIEICECIDPNYTPGWLKKINDISNQENRIANLNQEIIKIRREKELIHKPLNSKKVELDKSKRLRMEPNKKTKLVFGILLLPFLIGILLLATYTSPKKAMKNTKYRKTVQEDYDNLFKTTKIQDEKYQSEIDKCEKNIKIAQALIIKIENTNYNISKIDDKGFINLKSDFRFNKTEEFKGIYIIWNKTKNKYYVGQSKNVNKRIFREHFKNGDVNNIIFAKDWFEKDEFWYKTIRCETKDELDRLEKENIEKYNAFKNGYNSTGGNK